MSRPVTRSDLVAVAVIIPVVICVFIVLPRLVSESSPWIRFLVKAGPSTLLYIAAFIAVLRIGQQGSRTAPEPDTGNTAVVRRTFEKKGRLARGKVFAHGEIWSAVADCDPSLLPVGSECRIVEREGHLVRVEPS